MPCWPIEKRRDDHAIDIAFTIGYNDHPDFGGLELSLRDFRVLPAEGAPHGNAIFGERAVLRNAKIDEGK